MKKVVCINGKCFCQSDMIEVQRVFGKIAKKIIETKTMISIVI